MGRLLDFPEQPPSIQKTSSFPLGLFCMFIKCRETTVNEPMRNAHQKSLALQHRLQPVLGEYHRAVGKRVLQGLPDHLRSSEGQTNIGIQTAMCMPITTLTCVTAWLCVAELTRRDTALRCLSCTSAVKIPISHRVKVVPRLPWSPTQNYQHTLLKSGLVTCQRS